MGFATWLAIGLIGAAACAAGSPGPASAQTNFPTKPIIIVVPYPPGGSTDALARLLGKKMSEDLGQPVLVENRAGASGSIGSAHVAMSPPDGYTLLLGAGTTLAVNPHLYKNLAYDPLKGFTPVVLATYLPSIVAVHPSLPVANIGELTTYIKANRGKVNYASGGNGTPSHLGAELYRRTAKVEMNHIPYKGGASALTDLVGGHTQLMFPYLAESMTYVKSGKLKAVAVTTAKRSALLPDLPTAAESGLPGFEMVGWYGFVAPAGTPAGTIQILNRAFNNALADPGIRSSLESQAFEIAGGSPDEFGAVIVAEHGKWGQVIRDAGISAD
ncbi:MAG: Bug family tripartite tricarboxylate transporter substrate binding protein [Lautropia sp.]